MYNMYDLPPPSWAERKSTNDENQRTSTGIALKEATARGTYQTEAEVDQNQEYRNVVEGPIVTCFRKFIKTPSLISAILSITSNIILWVCGLAILVYGWLIKEQLNNPQKVIQGMELARVLISHANQFRVLSYTFMGSGIVLMVVVVPLGLIGVLRFKKTPVKLHILFIFLYLVIEAFMFYFFVMRPLHGVAKERALEQFQEDVRPYNDRCRVSYKESLAIQKCCCAININIMHCRNYYTNAPLPGDDDSNEYEFAIKKMKYEFDCKKYRDVFLRMRTVQKKAKIIVPIFMIIQLITLGFGVIIILQSNTLTEEEFLEKMRKKYRRSHKNTLDEISRIKTKISFKWVLLCVLEILFFSWALFL